MLLSLFYIFSKKTRLQIAKEIFGESDTSQSQDENNDNNKDDKAITTDKDATDNVSDIRNKYITLKVLISDFERVLKPCLK